MELKLLLVAALSALLFFLASVENSVACLSDVSLRTLAAEPQGSKRVRFLRLLLERRQVFWLSIAFGVQLCIIALAGLIVDLFLTPGVPGAVWAGISTCAVWIVLLRDVFPRLLVQNAPGRHLLRLLPAFQVYFRLIQPLVLPIHHAVKVFRESSEMSITPESAQMSIPDETLQALINVGEEEGIIEEGESEWIQSIIEFGDTTVKKVMTQRADMVCIEASATVEHVRDMMIEERHSRLPVYREDPDNIEGVVYIRDLLVCWSEGRTSAGVGEIARPAYFVPENKSVADLLEDMQVSKTQIAVVIDEFGGVSGLVTIEDILEEIVGEIEDEDDEESPEDIEIVEESKGVHLVRGNTEIRKIELLFNLEIASDDFTTVNGLITNEFGRVPEIGEQFNLRGLHIEVLEADGRAIRRVRLSKAPEPETTDEDGEREEFIPPTNK